MPFARCALAVYRAYLTHLKWPFENGNAHEIHFVAPLVTSIWNSDDALDRRVLAAIHAC